MLSYKYLVVMWNILQMAIWNFDIFLFQFVPLNERNINSNFFHTQLYLYLRNQKSAIKFQYHLHISQKKAHPYLCLSLQNQCIPHKVSAFVHNSFHQIAKSHKKFLLYKVQHVWFMRI